MADNSREFYDLPFVYTFDADALTDGQNYFNLSVPLIGDSDFILRRIAGRGLVAGALKYRDPQGRDRIQNFSHIPNDWPVVPEILYPAAGQILFDLQTVNRLNTPYAVGGSIPNYFSQIAFQGVRRFYGKKPPESAYAYYDKPYTIHVAFTVDWAGRIAPAYQVIDNTRRFSVYVDNYDFELHKMCIEIALPVGPAPGLPALSQAAMKLVLYAPGEQAMMSAPVVDLFLNENDGVINSVFPVPTILYPAASQILFDVQSLLIDTQIPAPATIDFTGVWRFPC